MQHIAAIVVVFLMAGPLELSAGELLGPSISVSTPAVRTSLKRAEANRARAATSKARGEESAVSDKPIDTRSANRRALDEMLEMQARRADGIVCRR